MKFFSVFKKSDKKAGLIFAGQILFLILSFFLVLWGQKKLKDFSEKSKAPPLERKAKIINSA